MKIINGLYCFIKHKPVIILFYLIFILFVYVGMVKHPLWGDEAETALFAKNILKYGIPYGWDGTNIMGIYNGITLNENLVNHTSPWVQYYMTAVSFAIFGISTFTARLPFVILSLLTVIFLFKLALRITQSSKATMLTVIAISISVPFILYAYQTRYYALTSLTSILLINFFISILNKEKFNMKYLIIACIAFFYSNYSSFFAFFLALVISSLILKINIIYLVKKLLLPSIIIIIFTLPWFIILRPWEGNSGYALVNFNFSNALDLFLRYLSDFNGNGGIPIILVMFFILYVQSLKNKKVKKQILFISTTCLLYILFFSFISTQNLDFTTHSDIRYAMNIYPLLLLLIGFVLEKIYSSSKILGFMVIGLYLFTTVLSLKFPSQSWLFAYFHEITNSSYKTSTEVTVNYLNKNIQRNETVFVTPDYNTEPLQFYLDDKIRFINRISPSNNKILSKNKAWLPAYVYNDPEPPDWIIMFGKIQHYDWRPLPINANLDNYEEIIIPTYAYDMSRPELFLHSFKPITNYPKESNIFIYKKKSFKID